MSAMRSASSTTTISTSSRRSEPRSRRSFRRPGVATTTSTPLLERLHLVLHAGAAVDGERPRVLVPQRQSCASWSSHLRGAARGWGRASSARGPAGRRLLDAGEEREAEGDGLAGAGGRLAADVAAGEGVGEGGGLDRERLGDAELGQAGAQGGGHAEGGEGGGHGGLSRWSGSGWLRVAVSSHSSTRPAGRLPAQGTPYRRRGREPHIVARFRPHGTRDGAEDVADPRAVPRPRLLRAGGDGRLRGARRARASTATSRRARRRWARCPRRSSSPRSSTSTRASCTTPSPRRGRPPRPPRCSRRGSTAPTARCAGRAATCSTSPRSRRAAELARIAAEACTAAGRPLYAGHATPAVARRAAPRALARDHPAAGVPGRRPHRLPRRGRASTASTRSCSTPRRARCPGPRSRARGSGTTTRGTASVDRPRPRAASSTRDGAFTEAGAALRQSIEDRTDALALGAVAGARAGRLRRAPRPRSGRSARRSSRAAGCRRAVGGR